MPSIPPVRTKSHCPFEAERSGEVREVGDQAIWSLSTCKLGFGVEHLRDNSMETYWQSDGQLPHLVNIQFPRKTAISHIYIYSDYKLDESYSPEQISVRAGTHFSDLNEIEIMDLCKPSGWIVVPVKNIRGQPLRTFMIQLAVIKDHENGRDTHMRQVRIHSPVEAKKIIAPEIINEYSTVEFQQFSTIR